MQPKTDTDNYPHAVCKAHPSKNKANADMMSLLE